MMVAKYKTKKECKAAVGTPLKYQETSMFGNEYKADGSFALVGPDAYNRKWYVEVTLVAGIITKVE